MIKKTIKFTNYEGNLETKDYYFHLTKLDVLKMTAALGEDMATYTENLVARQDLSEMIKFMELLILTAVGTRGEDQKTFTRNKSIRDAFEFSEAYAELFEELLTQPDVAGEFISSLITKSAVKPTTDIKALVGPTPNAEVVELEERLRTLRGE